MSTVAYSQVLKNVRKLEPGDQLRLLEDLASLVRRRVTSRSQSVLELKGLGKDLWQDLDVQAYIDQERDSWTG